MGVWDGFTAHIGGIIGGVGGGLTLGPWGAAGGALVGEYIQQQIEGGDRRTPSAVRLGGEADVRQQQQDALKQLMGGVPDSQERFDVARQALADQGSQQNQLLVANAASRGLLHSGVFRAQHQALERGLTTGLEQARAESITGPVRDRLAILQAMASGKPLPEVEIQEGSSGFLPILTGAAGAGIGLAVTGGNPLGALGGFQIGSSLGQGAQGGQNYPTARSLGRS